MLSPHAGTRAGEGRAARATRVLALLDRIRVIPDEQAAEALVAELCRPARPFVVSFVNAHAVNLCWADRGIFEDLAGADLVLRDGAGVKLGMQASGRPHGLNMNGTDFIPRLLRAHRGRRVALFGTQAPWLDAARERLVREAGISVVACHDGFAQAETYVQMALAARPELVLLAMGMPKQEGVAAALRRRLAHPALIVNGGAILDFLGGKVTRAPLLLRRAGLEWLYRLWLEPRRLFRRYVIGNPLFFARLTEASLRQRALGA